MLTDKVAMVDQRTLNSPTRERSWDLGAPGGSPLRVLHPRRPPLIYGVGAQSGRPQPSRSAVR